MKRHTKIVGLISIVLLIVVLLIIIFVNNFSANPVTPDKKVADLKDFTITIEMTERGVKLHSLEGSAWLDLELYPLTKREMAFDQYGSASSFSDDSATADFIEIATDPDLANYLMTIAKSEDGVVLKGYKGTAWKTLTFSLQVGDKKSINQNGMI
ncbi:MAG: hypothetical protein GX993_00295 [Bacteroidales bacterium]|nr:hypothetical protein [Bacteroidales bacterium]